MTASNELVLIDLPSRAPCKSWSSNPGKIRLLLNYKGLPYKTKWVEYPDLKPTLEAHVPPVTERDFMQYTSPTVIFPDGKYIMDSENIRAEIEKRYPEPTVHLDSPILPKLEDLMTKLRIMAPIFIPLVPKRLLTEASMQYCLETRERLFGMPMDQLEKEQGGLERMHVGKPYLDEVTALLKGDPSGPYFMGKEISYADLIWAAFLIFWQRIGMDTYEALLKTIGEDADVHSGLLVALNPYIQRLD